MQSVSGIAAMIRQHLLTLLLPSNGVKSCELNGSEVSKSSKAAVPLKALPTKPQVEQSSRKDISAMSRLIECLLAHRNGFEKHKNVDAVEGETHHTFAAASENGHSQNGACNSVKPQICDSNDTTSKLTPGRGHDQLELQNGGMKYHADISGLKRKLRRNPAFCFRRMLNL
ncbi:hypothetical protein POTOM_060797 [Populus tomentosa]|uniref:Uncharacterized protein n=1 Tax=Populus tomentosa TaxID=118781 RepID=A0A8X8BVQ5_POPTO|nr:hypothetical protein POTOM_060797 [Populus tomentosa]